MAYRIMETNEFKNSVFYRASCDCCMPNHDLVIEISADDWPSMAITLTAKYEHSIYWGRLNWFQRQWKRITGALRILFLGRLKVEYEFMIIDDDHINAFIEALQEGRQRIKQYRSGGD
jgi:hypothetical protein